MIEFFSNHAETIVSTTISTIVSFFLGYFTSTYFYRRSKKDSDKSAEEYKKLHLDGQKEIKDLKKGFATHDKTANDTGSKLNNLVQFVQSSNEFNITATDVIIKIKAYLAENAIDEAEFYFEGKKKMLEGTIHYYFIESLIATKKGKIDYSLSILNSIVENFRDSNFNLDFIYKAIADLHINYLEDYFSAKEYYIEALKISNKDEYLLGLAKCYVVLRKLDLAEDTLSIVLDKKSNKYLVIKADILTVQQKFKEGLKIIDKVLESDEYDLDALIVKAGICMHLSEFDVAIKAANTVTMYSVDKSLYRQSLTASALLYYITGDMIASEGKSQYLYSIYPTYIGGLDIYFAALIRLQKYQRVIDVGERFNINHIASEVPLAANSLGLAYIQLDENEKAYTCFKTIISLYPENIIAMNNLLIVFTKRGIRYRSEEALYYCNLVKDKDNLDSPILHNLAYLYLLHFKFDDALDTLKQVHLLGVDYELTEKVIAIVKELAIVYLKYGAKKTIEEYDRIFSQFSHVSKVSITMGSYKTEPNEENLRTEYYTQDSKHPTIRKK